MAARRSSESPASRIFVSAQKSWDERLGPRALISPDSGADETPALPEPTGAGETPALPEPTGAGETPALPGLFTDPVTTVQRIAKANAAMLP